MERDIVLSPYLYTQHSSPDLSVSVAETLDSQCANHACFLAEGAWSGGHTWHPALEATAEVASEPAQLPAQMGPAHMAPGPPQLRLHPHATQGKHLQTPAQPFDQPVHVPHGGNGAAACMQHVTPAETGAAVTITTALAAPFGDDLSIGAPPPGAQRQSLAGNPARGATGGVLVGSRRGRKPKPRLPDLQHRLDSLTERFQHLSRENCFLRNKLKALERIMPQRDSSVGFLASVQEAQRQVAHADAAACAAGKAMATGAVATHAPPPPLSPGAAAAAAAAPPDGAAAAPMAAAASDTGSSHAAAAPGAGAVAGSYSLPATQTVSLHTNRGHSEGAGGGPASAAPHATAAASHPHHAPAFPTLAGAAPGPAQQPRPGPGPGPGSSQHAVEQEPRVGMGSWSVWQTEHLPGTPLVVALCPGPDGEVPALTPAAAEELKRMTPRDFQRLWKHCVHQAAVLVAAAEAMGPSSPQYARLERYVGRMLNYIDRVLLLAPSAFVPCMYLNLETGERERPDDEFWAALVRVLALTPQQLEEVDSIALMYEHNVACVLAERSRLASELSYKLAVGAWSCSRLMLSAEGLSALSDVDHLAQQLERTVLRERQAYTDIEDFLCWSVLTPLQLGKVLAASYPYIPDGIAIMHSLKAQRGGSAAAAAPPPAAAGTAGGSGGSSQATA